jgi:GxxExxY protein
MEAEKPQDAARTAEKLNALTSEIIAAAIEVHRHLGPGLLESVYEACLEHELKLRGYPVERQLELPVIYKGVRLDCGFRVDLMVVDQVVVEIKASHDHHPRHEAQTLTYLRLSDKRVGLLLNFGVATLKDGIRRLVNRFPEAAG